MGVSRLLRVRYAQRIDWSSVFLPSPLYSGVRGKREQKSLTLPLSPEYKGEGRQSATHLFPERLEPPHSTRRHGHLVEEGGVGRCLAELLDQHFHGLDGIHL